MVQLKRKDGEKIDVRLRLPRKEVPTSDWGWFHFSVIPSPRIRKLLERGDVQLKDPSFRMEESEDGRQEYYLAFQLTRSGRRESPREKHKPERKPEPRKKKIWKMTPRAWGRPTKAALAILSLLFISLLIYTFPGVPVRVIASGSMAPTLNKGDLILMKPPTEIEEGDIVGFEVPKAYQDKYGLPNYLVHRVMEVSGQYLKTKGDATGPDPFKPKIDTVTGVYIGFKIPQLGHIFLFLHSVYGRTYAILTIVALTFYSTLPPWLERSRKKEERVTRALRSAVDTQRSLASFSSAMGEYAKHLKSHTSAIKGLAETTKHLDRTTTELERTMKELRKSRER